MAWHPRHPMATAPMAPLAPPRTLPALGTKWDIHHTRERPFHQVPRCQPPSWTRASDLIPARRSNLSDLTGLLTDLAHDRGFSSTAHVGILDISNTRGYLEIGLGQRKWRMIYCWKSRNCDRQTLEINRYFGQIRQNPPLNQGINNRK